MQESNTNFIYRHFMLRLHEAFKAAIADTIVNCENKKIREGNNRNGNINTVL